MPTPPRGGNPYSPAQSVSPAVQTSSASYVDVAGSEIDTGVNGETYVAFLLSCITHDVTFTVLGSIDQASYTALVTMDATGTDAAADIAVTAAATPVNAIVAPGVKNGARSAFRYYKVQIKDTVGGSHGVATVQGFAKR